MTTTLTTIGIVLLCLVAVFGIVLLYGKAKEIIGETRKENADVGEKQERESKAKQIESQPAPNTPDGVADLFDGMRSIGDKRTSRPWRFPALPWINKR